MDRSIFPEPCVTHPCVETLEGATQSQCSFLPGCSWHCCTMKSYSLIFDLFAHLIALWVYCVWSFVQKNQTKLSLLAVLHNLWPYFTLVLNCFATSGKSECLTVNKCHRSHKLDGSWVQTVVFTELQQYERRHFRELKQALCFWHSRYTSCFKGQRWPEGWRKNSYSQTLLFEIPDPAEKMHDLGNTTSCVSAHTFDLIRWRCSLADSKQAIWQQTGVKMWNGC